MGRPIAYDPETVVLGIGVTQEIAAGGITYLEILGATADAVWASFDGSTFFPMPIGVAIQFNPEYRLWIRNRSGATNTIIVAKGRGMINDQRVQLVTTATLTFTPVVPLGNTPLTDTPNNAALTAVVVVAAGANLNGIDLQSAVVSTADLPDAQAFVTAGSRQVSATPGTSSVLPWPRRIPAGVELSYSTCRDSVVSISYTVL